MVASVTPTAGGLLLSGDTAGNFLAFDAATGKVLLKKDLTDAIGGGYHHHIGLNTCQSKEGAPPAAGATGLYHLAILYPTRAALADALRRLIRAGIALTGAADHGASEALYLNDPDGNGVELYWDRPRSQWPHHSDGSLAMYTHPLGLDDLLAEAK